MIWEKKFRKKPELDRHIRELIIKKKQMDKRSKNKMQKQSQNLGSWDRNRIEIGNRDRIEKDIKKLINITEDKKEGCAFKNIKDIA